MVSYMLWWLSRALFSFNGWFKLCWRVWFSRHFFHKSDGVGYNDLRGLFGDPQTVSVNCIHRTELEGSLDRLFIL